MRGAGVLTAVGAGSGNGPGPFDWIHLFLLNGVAVKCWVRYCMYTCEFNLYNCNTIFVVLIGGGEEPLALLNLPCEYQKETYIYLIVKLSITIDSFFQGLQRYTFLARADLLQSSQLYSIFKRSIHNLVTYLTS